MSLTVGTMVWFVMTVFAVLRMTAPNKALGVGGIKLEAFNPIAVSVWLLASVVCLLIYSNVVFHAA